MTTYQFKVNVNRAVTVFSDSSIKFDAVTGMWEASLTLYNPDGTVKSIQKHYTHEYPVAGVKK